MAPKISVIVPLYNAEKFIDRCMASIYAQTFTDYEIILVDDGSTDNSAKLCREYAQKDKRITFISKENGGAGSARNMGIEIAKGEYLAFPDVDDWFEPNMYQELYAAASAGNYDVVFSGITRYKKEKGTRGIVFYRTELSRPLCCHTQQECRENIMKVFPTTIVFDSPCNKLYKRSIAIEHNVRFSNTRRCQDAMFNIDFYNAIDSAISVDKAYYNYLTNDQEAVNRKFPKNYIDINIAYYTKLIGILQSWDMYTGDIKKHYDTSVVLAVYGTMGMFENPQWAMRKKEQKEYVQSILARQDLHKLLVGADVREDAKKEATIILHRDYKAFMLAYKKEKIKNGLRKNKFIMGVYRKLRGTENE